MAIFMTIAHKILVNTAVPIIQVCAARAINSFIDNHPALASALSLTLKEKGLS